jgi:PKD repeat protein
VPSTSGFAPFTAQFTDQSSGVGHEPPVELRRRHELERAAPQHVYAVPGFYTVSLMVTVMRLRHAGPRAT